jgi:hypothetical protein
MAKHSGDGHKTETPDVSHIRNEEVTHEKSDINVNGVLTFVVALTIMTIGIFIGLIVLFNYFKGQAAKEVRPGPMALSQQERLPPEPRLQEAPGFGVTLEDGTRVDLQATRDNRPQAEFATLNEQWQKELNGQIKDASGNPKTIPIDEAIKKVVAGDGLPARTKEAPGDLRDYAISTPTAASSGRVSEKRVQ